MSRTTHSLVGYDRQTEHVAEEFDVSDAILPGAKKLAHVPDDDPDAIMCYPLNPSGAQKLANMLKATIDPEQRDYFLEGFAGAAAPYEFANDEKLRKEPLSEAWFIWIHNDAAKDHIRATIERTALDDYAGHHGHKNHFAVIDRLNARISNQVREIINQAIDDGRVISGCLELNERDLAAMLDE